MVDKKNERRGQARTHHRVHGPRGCLPEACIREYQYVLRTDAAATGCLQRNRELLIAGTADFAEVFYNFLFDNPDVADVLYSFERNGGDVGDLVRGTLACMLAGLTGEVDSEHGQQLIQTGADLFEQRFRPAWLVAGYNLLLNHLQARLAIESVTAADRPTLESAISTTLLRDMGLMLEGYWDASSRALGRELGDLTTELATAENLLAGIPHLLWSVDLKSNCVIYANYPMHALYEGALESPFPFLADTSAEDRQPMLTAWQNAVSGSHCTAEIRMRLVGGEEHWYRLSLYPAQSRGDKPVVVHCVLEDINHMISERKLLERLATTDRLTNLPNRALWADHLSHALAASRRMPGSQVVVISLDINQFKMYNDTLGRDVGDVLLRDVASRLKSVIRESDSLARLGGDRFGVLLQPVNNARTATDRVITQILDSFDMPFTCSDRQLCISLTMGIALFPEDGTNEESLLTNAESAMQRAKRNGLPYQYFDPRNDVSSVEQLRYSGQIRTALDNDEFLLHYQPQIDIRSSRITGAEALLRWEHPVEGTLMPQRIIPVAEQLGMISSITDWVLVTALDQCRQWTHDGIAIPVSVNVSARCFQNPRLLEKIEWALRESGVEGDSLEIEITEATLMQDLDRATEVLQHLSDSGVRIAIDDFGTGYSSLSYLKRLPIHTLKIDQSFIMDVAFDQQDVAIVRSIIDLGHNLGYKVIAEGVENSMAWDMLNHLGCDTAQGFHISKPLPDQHFSDWLANSHAAP